MLFNSIAFALFLPLVFGLYWGVFQKNKTLRNAFLLVASYVFYGFWDWRFLILIFISSLCDFFIARGIEAAEQKSKKKWLLSASLVVNLGILGFFKYFNFFLDSLYTLLGLTGAEPQLWTLKILLPVGISFYTFQTLSYSIDVYRGTVKAERDPVAFFAFVAFFPQLVAGPIERAKNMLPQFHEDKKFSYPQGVEGLRWILWGFFKKLVIADRMAIYVEQIFSQPENYHGPAIILGGILFGFQVYCDFSGYSAIAIGVAKLFGFELMVNFRTPFFSASIREFWNRWHISLSTWFRDYVYFPIGGSRNGRFLWGVAILATFLTSGLWHGAAFTYIVFGLIHGVFYLIEQSLARALKEKIQIPRWLGVLSTFSIVTIAWLFFRAPDFAHVFVMLKNLFSGWQPLFQGSESLLQTLADLPGVDQTNWYMWVSLVLMLVIEGFMGKGTFAELMGRIPRPARWGMAYFLIIWILIFGAYQLKTSFVYFQF